MYKLASNINVFQDQNKEGATEYFVNVLRRKETQYVINKVIYDFLLCFSERKSLESVIFEYIQLTSVKKAEEHVLQEQLTLFFEQLKKKKWIISEDDLEYNYFKEAFYTINDRINTYKVVQVLANNSDTDVYLVKDPNKNKKYVIKLLNTKKFVNPDNYTRHETYFNNEFNFIKSFHSIYINKGISYVKHPDYSYMLLEHISGNSIRRYLKKHQVTSKQKLELVFKLLKGFAIIHKEGIYHGDIHLSNVLITEKFQVKIIDFGYSNYAKLHDEKSNKKTRNGGVHAFIPPERTLRSISRKFNAVQHYQSEVYQIGLLIYYVFVTELPFKAETWKTMVDEIQEFQIETYLPFIKRRMPKSVRRIIIKCLDQNPEKRYKNGQALLLEWKKMML